MSYSVDNDFDEPTLTPMQLLMALETTPTSGSGTPSDFDNDFQFQPNLALAMGSSDIPSINLGVMPPPPGLNLVAFGDMLKQHKKLNPKSAVELRTYCATHNIEERLVLEFALNLEIRDLLLDLTKPSCWTMTEELKKTISLYAKAFILSPNVRSYKGNGPTLVLQAMRKLNVADLPAEQNVVQVEDVLSMISDKLTSFRNTVKNKIVESLNPSSTFRNIAALAHNLTSQTRLKSTLSFYMRLAFLRFIYVSLFSKTPPPTTVPGLTSDDVELVKKMAVQFKKERNDLKEATFWDEVDGALAELVKTATSGAEITAFMNRIYSYDKGVYGDPAVSQFTAAEPTAVEEWTRTIDEFASATGQQKRKRTTGQ